jgi:hypothetical protein
MENLSFSRQALIFSKMLCKHRYLGVLQVVTQMTVAGWMLFQCSSAFSQTINIVPQSTPSSTASISLGTVTSNMMLLSDGSVMVQAGFYTNQWYRLRPDPSSGSYHTNNISWSNAASMVAKRSQYASWVVPSSTGANLVVAGGLQTALAGFGMGAAPAVEIYNPVLDTWTSSTSTTLPNGNSVLNAPSVLLKNGLILFGDVASSNTYLYDPSTDSWSAAGSKAQNEVNTTAGTFINDTNDGQTFTLMPGTNASVLTWPIQQNLTVLPPPNTSPAIWAGSTAYSVGNIVVHNNNYYYCVSAGTSGATGPTGTNPGPDGGVVACTQPVIWQYQKAYGQTYSGGVWALTATDATQSTYGKQLTDTTFNYGSDLSIGPATVLPNGKVIQFGANGTSALFTPSSGGVGPGAWAAGPATAGDAGCAPGAMLPNGNFLVALDNAHNPATSLYTYNYSTNTLTKVNGISFSTGAANLRMLVLPNGHVWVNSGVGEIYDIDFGGTPVTGTVPTTSAANVNLSSGKTYTLKGTLLTGTSAGACYGGNTTSATNYPIVRLVSKVAGGPTYYANTYNWTPQVHAISDAGTSTINFDVPANLSIGTYDLSVIANGIPSASQTFKFSGIQTTMNMAYDSANHKLTLTPADNFSLANNLNVSVTYSNKILTVAGTTATTAGAQNVTTQITYNGVTASKQTINYGTNVNLTSGFTLNATFGNGNDYFVINGVPAKSVNVSMSGGNDTVSVLYSTLGSAGSGANSSVNIDGGTGTRNTFGQAASVLTDATITNFQVILPP